MWTLWKYQITKEDHRHSVCPFNLVIILFHLLSLYVLIHPFKTGILLSICPWKWDKENETCSHKVLNALKGFVPNLANHWCLNIVIVETLSTKQCINYKACLECQTKAFLGLYKLLCMHLGLHVKVMNI